MKMHELLWKILGRFCQQYNHGFKYPDFVKFGVDKDDEDARITLENFGPVLSTNLGRFYKWPVCRSQLLN